MSKKKVLQDHKQVGKTFLPPFKHMLGPLKEISWAQIKMPELIWISLIQNYYGHQKGVSLITNFTKLTRECVLEEKRQIFATISSFQELTKEEKLMLVKNLKKSEILSQIQNAILPLIDLYPKCHLRFLFSKRKKVSDDINQHLKIMRETVENMYDMTSKGTMMVQATAIWLAFKAEKLKVFEGSALSNFPEIEQYPTTDLSKKIASSIRASMYMFFIEPHYPKFPIWPIYFWNRGLEIDNCYFKDSIYE